MVEGERGEKERGGKGKGRARRENRFAGIDQLRVDLILPPARERKEKKRGEKKGVVLHDRPAG